MLSVLARTKIERKRTIYQEIKGKVIQVSTA